MGNKKNTKKWKTVSLDALIDKHIGKTGSPKRDRFESNLSMELLGYSIKKVRQNRKLTQEQLGERVGVQKAQISKLENSFKNARIDTILKVFDALDATIQFRVIM